MTINIKSNGQGSINLHINLGDNLNPGYTDPTYIMHRRPLPMVAHVEARRVTGEAYELVASMGAIPVYHTNQPSIQSRRAIAMAKARAAIESAHAEWESAKIRVAQANARLINISIPSDPFSLDFTNPVTSATAHASARRNRHN